MRSPEVCRRAGITYRQLDYWTRTGLVIPSEDNIGGSGHPREYADTDLALVMLIKRLLDDGRTLRSIRKRLLGR